MYLIIGVIQFDGSRSSSSTMLTSSFMLGIESISCMILLFQPRVLELDNLDMRSSLIISSLGKWWICFFFERQHKKSYLSQILLHEFVFGLVLGSDM